MSTPRAIPFTAATVTAVVVPPRVFKAKASAENLIWVKSICAPGIPVEQVQLINHWIFEPENFQQSLEEAFQTAQQLKQQTRVLALCDVNDDYYLKCLAPILNGWNIAILALRNFSAAATIDMISLLNFTGIEKIALRNMPEQALFYLYTKLMARNMEGFKDIQIICGEGISEVWKMNFSLIKNPQHQEQIIKRDYASIANSWLKSTASKTRLKGEHTQYLAQLDVAYVEKMRIIVEEKLAINARVAELELIIKAQKEQEDNNRTARKVEKSDLLRKIKDLETQIQVLKNQAENAAKLKQIEVVAEEFLISPEGEMQMLNTQLLQLREILEDTTRQSEINLRHVRQELADKTTLLKIQKGKEKELAEEIAQFQILKRKLTTEVTQLRQESTTLSQANTELTTDKAAQAKQIEELTRKLTKAEELATVFEDELKALEPLYEGAEQARVLAEIKANAAETLVPPLEEKIVELEAKKRTLKIMLKTDISTDGSRKRKREDEDLKESKTDLVRANLEIARLTALLKEHETRAAAQSKTACESVTREAKLQRVSDATIAKLQREFAAGQSKYNRRDLFITADKAKSVTTISNLEAENKRLKEQAAKAKKDHEAVVASLQAELEEDALMSSYPKGKSPSLSARHLSPAFGSRRSSMSLSPQVKGGIFSSALMSVSPINSSISGGLSPIPPLKLEDRDVSGTTCSTSSTISITSPVSTSSIGSTSSSTRKTRK
jgi:hypothetical protein